MGWIVDCCQLLLGRAESEARLEPVNLAQEAEGQKTVARSGDDGMRSGLVGGVRGRWARADPRL